VVREPIDPDLEALRSGDEAAFEALIGRCHGPMLRLAMTYLRDRGAAEDAVQETWLHASERWTGSRGARR
jgi:RNA polymerase sigma-70 factor (ECF subfamily)